MSIKTWPRRRDNAPDNDRKPAAEEDSTSILEWLAGGPIIGDHLNSLAIKHAPTDERFYLNRGRCLLEKGDSLASLKDFDAAIRLRKDYEKAHFSRGNALFTLGRFKDSIAAYTWVTNTNGNHAPQAFYNRGVAWERLNQPTKAASDMKKAKQLGFAP